MLHDGVVAHRLPGLLHEVVRLFGKPVNVACFWPGHAACSDAGLVGLKHRFGGYLAQMGDQPPPDCIGGENGNLLTDDRPDERLEQIVSTRDAVGTELGDHGSQEGILSQMVVSGLPPIRDSAAHAGSRAGEVFNPRFKPSPCETCSWRTWASRTWLGRGG